MNTKLVREVDSQGRFLLPIGARNCLGIENEKTTVYFVAANEDTVWLTTTTQKGDFVLGASSVDSKGRFVIPKDLRQEQTQFEIILYDGRLALK